jgi:type II secretory pathway predicted ATPase ExeA
MVLTGGPGTGKSTLVKHWMSQLEPKRHLPIFIPQSSLSATGVLEILLAKLGERPRFKRSTNLLVLEKHLAELDPLTLVLVLDDAQNYPGPALEELRLLLGLGGAARSAFAMLLLGDEYLLGSLRLSVQRALFTRISAAVQLAALPREEIAPYLNWHVPRAGLDRDIFAPAAIDLLAEASAGNPRILGLLAQAAWLHAARSATLEVAPQHVHAALRQVPSANTRVTSA